VVGDTGKCKLPSALLALVLREAIGPGSRVWTVGCRCCVGLLPSVEQCSAQEISSSKCGVLLLQAAWRYFKPLLLIESCLILDRKLCAAGVLHLVMPVNQPDQMELRFPRPWCSKQAWSSNALSLQECLHGFEVDLANHCLHRK